MAGMTKRMNVAKGQREIIPKFADTIRKYGIGEGPIFVKGEGGADIRATLHFTRSGSAVIAFMEPGVAISKAGDDEPFVFGVVADVLLAGNPPADAWVNKGVRG